MMILGIKKEEEEGALKSYVYDVNNTRMVLF